MDICFILQNFYSTYRGYGAFSLCYSYFTESNIHHRWCLHFIVVVGVECSWDPESYAGGSVATGRGTQAGRVKG
jgi:hypothetical protein